MGQASKARCAERVTKGLESCNSICLLLKTPVCWSLIPKASSTVLYSRHWAAVRQRRPVAVFIDSTSQIDDRLPQIACSRQAQVPGSPTDALRDDVPGLRPM